MTKPNPLALSYIGPGTRVCIDGIEYQAASPYGQGWELNSLEGKARFVTEAQIKAGERDGTITVDRPSVSPFSPTGSNFSVLANFSPEDQRCTLRNLLLVTELQEALKIGLVTGRSCRAVEGWRNSVAGDLQAKLHAIEGQKQSRKKRWGSKPPANDDLPSGRHLLRMLKTFEEAGCSVLALRPKTGEDNKGGRQLAPAVREIVLRCAREYAGEANPTFKGLHQLVRAEVLKDNQGLPPHLWITAPCVKTIAKHARDLPEGLLILGRKGPSALQRKLGAFGNGPRYYRVGERVEFDCWNIPLHLLFRRGGVWDEIPAELQEGLTREEGRISLAVAIDCATGFFVGFRPGLTESSALVRSVLRDCVSDKSALAVWAGCSTPYIEHSGIEEGCSDGGPAYYHSLYWSTAVSLCGRYQFAAGGKPWLRGLVESTLSTIHKGFISKFCARAFENIAAKGDYKPMERANLLLTEFLKLLVLYIVDVYHNLPNGKDKRSPRQRYAALSEKYEPKRPPTADQLRMYFGTTVTRKLGPQGIRFLGIQYHSNWLAHYRSHRGDEQVMVKVDELDLGAVSALLGDMWVRIPGPAELSGVPVGTWKAMTEELARRYGDEAELDFATYVGPALLRLDAAIKAAENKMGLVNTVATEEYFQRLEEQLRIHPVFDKPPEQYSVAPSLSSGTLGKLYGPSNPTASQPSAADKSEPGRPRLTSKDY